MDSKLKTFRERLTDDNEDVFSSIKEDIDEGLEVLMDMEVVDEKKGEICISGHGFSAKFKDLNYAKKLLNESSQLSASAFKVLYIDDYVYIKVFTPYPWLPDRKPMENPPIEQPVPDLSMPTSEEQKMEVRIVGIKYHASDTDVSDMQEMSKNAGKVTLMVESDNEKDSYAVCACLPSGKMVGYVKSESAPFLSDLIKSEGNLEAEIRYVDYQGEYADVIIQLEYNKSIDMVNLFSRHTPQAIYKAMFMNRKWLSSWEDEEDQFLDPDNMLLNFEYILSFPIRTQNKIASLFKDLMKKAKVDNPTNPGLTMSVPLDLSVYGTRWEDIDLVKDKILLDLIDAENNLMASFLRFRRTVMAMANAQTFMDYTGITIKSETMLARMNKETEKDPSFRR